MVWNASHIKDREKEHQLSFQGTFCYCCHTLVIAPFTISITPWCTISLGTLLAGGCLVITTTHLLTWKISTYVIGIQMDPLKYFLFVAYFMLNTIFLEKNLIFLKVTKFIFSANKTNFTSKSFFGHKSIATLLQKVKSKSKQPLLAWSAAILTFCEVVRKLDNLTFCKVFT